MPDSVLQSILSPLAKEGERLDAEIAKTEARLHDLKSQRATISRVLRAASFAKAKPQPAPRPNRKTALKKPLSSQVSEEKLHRVLAYIQEHGEVTSREIREGLQIAESSVHAAIRLLRNHEQIRLAGIRREGQAHKAPAVYAPMPHARNGAR